MHAETRSGRSAARVRALSVLWAVPLMLLTAATALADCADFAGPGVYWRRCQMDGIALQKVDLTGADLRDASFKRADLSDGVLVKVEARRAKFVSARLHRINLDEAKLVQADLTSADLTGATLRKADLQRAKLYRTILRDADLTGARLGGADLLYADLAGARWIDGKTICAEGSIGRCIPAGSPLAADADASG